MKRMKQWIAGLLVICIVACICGCGITETTDMKQDAEVLYKLGEIQDMGNILQMKVLENGQYFMAVYEDDTFTCVKGYISEDRGKSWKAAFTLDQDSPLLKGLSYLITAVDLTEDGQILCSYEILDDQYQKIKSVTRFVESETVFWEESEKGVITTGKSSGDYILVNTQDSVLVFDAQGTLQETYEVEDCIDCIMNEDTLYVLSKNWLVSYENGERIEKFTKISDVLSVELQKLIELNAIQLHRNGILQVYHDEIWLAFPEAVYVYHYRNDVLEEKYSEVNGITGKITGFILNQNQPYVAAYFEDKNVVELLSATEGGEQMFLITAEGVADETMKEEVKTLTGQIEIYSLYPMECIENAVRDFSGDYKDLEVSYTVGVEDNNVTVSEAINALNSRIMTGAGPDVIIMDGLDVESLVKKGVLMDLAGVYEDRKEDVLENVCTTFQTGEQIYALPTRFKCYMDLVPVGRDTVTTSALSLKDYLKDTDSDMNDLYLYTAEGMMEMFYPMYVDAIYSETGIEKEKLQAFFQDMKDIYGLCSESNNSFDKLMIESNTQEIDSFDGFNVIPNFNNFTEVSVQKEKWTLITMGPLDSHIGILHLLAATEYLKTHCGQSMEYGLWDYEQKEAVYVPTVIAGIMDGTDNYDSAIIFVEGLLSEEYGKYEDAEYVYNSFGGYEKYGISVSQNVRNAVAKKYAKMIYSMTSKDGRFERLELRTKLTEAEMEQFETLYTHLSNNAYVEVIKHDMIAENLDLFVHGEITIQEAVENVVADMELYMEETH